LTAFTDFIIEYWSKNKGGLEMVTIDVDKEVIDKLKEIAIPFVDLTPNHVIRRILGMKPGLVINTTGALEENLLTRGVTPSSLTSTRRGLARDQMLTLIDELHRQTGYVNSAFLTFLIDKYCKTEGNFKSSNIMNFMDKFNLHTNTGYRNPWMSKPYKNKNSCDKTIYHFNQCRKYGCWNNNDSKINCSFFSCVFHPQNNSDKVNKCDLRKGVIWKKENPQSLSFRYGALYLDVIKNEIMNGEKFPLKLLLNIFYLGDSNDIQLIHRFKTEFNFNDNEMDVIFYLK
jgi:hypothetical protein